MRTFLFLFFLLFTITVAGQKNGAKNNREYLVIRVYHAADTIQLAAIDHYLQASLLPTLNQNGFSRTGVFQAVDNDTAKDKRFYVFLPFSSLSQLEKLNGVIDKTLADTLTASAYTNALYNAPPYSRMESILLQAFEGMPQVKSSSVKGDIQERVYELRSYESATEALHQNKVRMFNLGEIDLFQRLGFKAVFYGQVIAGSQMPNLMYMTSFDNKTSRDDHWRMFGNDPNWKTMSAKPEYQHNVSKITITFLRPTSYSKL